METGLSSPRNTIPTTPDQPDDRRDKVRARVVLDEWLRQGIVSMSGYVVRLQEMAFIPKEGFDEKVHYFSRNLRDHIAAGAHNLEVGSTPFFDRSVYYDQLSAEDP